MITKTGPWKEALAILAAGVKESLGKAVQQEALHYEEEMKKNFGAGTAPLASARANGSSKPLMKSGDLRASIKAQKDGPMAAFIGINKNAKAHGGKAYDIARVHEFGATIVQVMTDKQRRYLFAVVFKGQAAKQAGEGSVKGFLMIRIPARPFVQPTFDKLGPDTTERIMKRFAALLQGKFGTP